MPRLLVTTQVQIDINDTTRVPIVEAMCSESDTRAVEIILLQHGKLWAVPSGTAASVCYVSPDGHKGEYYTCADGAPAVAIEDNKANVVLIGSVLRVPGTVHMYLVLTNKHTGGVLYIPFNVNVIELI